MMMMMRARSTAILAVRDGCGRLWCILGGEGWWYCGGGGGFGAVAFRWWDSFWMQQA